MKYKTERWMVEKLSHPLNEIHKANFKIVEDGVNKFPICSFPIALGDTQPPKLLAKQESIALFMLSAPHMYNLLIDAREELIKMGQFVPHTSEQLSLISNITEVLEIHNSK